MSGHIRFIFSTATFSAKVLPACTAGEKAVACPLCTASYHVTQHSCQRAKVTMAHLRYLLWLSARFEIFNAFQSQLYVGSLTPACTMKILTVQIRAVPSWQGKPRLGGLPSSKKKMKISRRSRRLDQPSGKISLVSSWALHASEISEYLNIWIFEYLDVWIFGYLNIRIFEYLNIWPLIFSRWHFN